MAIYTVHVPEQVSDTVKRADRTVFVREGFNGGAFVFGSLYLILHRLWAALAVWILLIAAVMASGWALRLSPGLVLALVLLMHLFVGVEGNDLRRWGLGRRRFRLADVVSGSRRDEAEYAFFLRQPEDEPTVAPVVSRVAARTMSQSVIGMFPDETGG